MSQPTSLITGITGQDGSYLSELLLEKGYIVHGIVRPRSSLRDIQRLWDNPNIRDRALVLHQAEITGAAGLRRALRAARPAEVYHLAGQSAPGRSFEIPELTREETGEAAINFLRIAREEVPDTRFFHASSAEVFGNTSEVPQRETTPFSPTNPYGEAKADATREVRRFREEYSFFACNGILYNHESPRRGETFVTRKIARGAARIARGLQSELILGSLDSRRDWGRAQDYVRAMWMILQHDVPDDYIVATGKTHSVREFVQAAFGIVGLSWEKFVTSDPALTRPSDPQLVGCSDKIRERLGWRPTGDFEELVREMVQSELDAIDPHGSR